MRTQWAAVGPLATASATNVRTASTISGAGAVTLNGALVSGGVATFDKPRRVIFTSVGNDSGITFSLTGTNWAGQTVTETVTGANAGVASSVLDYATLTSVVASGASAGNVSIGTNGVAASPWVKFNAYSLGTVLAQLVVTGTVNFTLQLSLDDPTNPSGNNPVTAPATMTWSSTNDTAAVNATTNVISNFMFVPIWARILLNSGSGSVQGTFVQSGSGVG